MAVAKRNNHDTTGRMEMKNLYQTKEWKSLPVMERAYLLPTMEGIRKGCLVNTKNISNISDLEYCLNEKGLKYHKEDNNYFVSKNKTLLEKVVKKWESAYIAKSFQGIDKDIDKIVKGIEEEYHRVIGKFFGYPDCCIKHFTKATLKGTFATREWHKKAGKALLEKKYNKLFDYVFHAPCGLECEESLKVARKIKKCLESYDFEAAESFRKSNRHHVERAAKKCTTT